MHPCKCNRGSGAVALKGSRKERHHQAAPNFGLEPRRLGRHHSVLPAHVDKLVDRDGRERDGEVVPAGVDLGAEVRRVAVAADKDGARGGVETVYLVVQRVLAVKDAWERAKRQQAGRRAVLRFLILE